MFKKKKIIIYILVTIFIFTISTNMRADDNMFEGNWQGYIDISGQHLNVIINITQKEDSLLGTIDIPAQNLEKYPLEIETTQENIKLFMNGIPGDVVFNGKYENEQIIGTFTQFGSDFDFILTKGSSEKSDSDQEEELLLDGTEQNIEVPVLNGTLKGSLTFPEVYDINNPLAILIAGSGPTDRDGNSQLINTKINNLKEIAYYLTKKGVLTIRFDKRGVKESRDLITEKTPVFSQYKNDIIDIIDYAKNNLGKKNNQIFLIGHSEGSTLSIMVAKEINDLAGLILLAGPGYKQEDLLRTQIKAQNEALYEKGLISDPNVLTTALNDLIKSIENDNEFNLDKYDIPDNFKMVYTSLNNQRDFSKEWLKVDPAILLKQTSVPVSIIQGLNDQQVSKEDAIRLSEFSLGKYSDLHLLEGVDHLLHSDQYKVDQNLLTIINEFIKKHK
ncbi:MAG: alpha/beta hydrolase [Halanaerobiales bacterium]|nr:alpha/beta hydrolase [Halanaerobiales bacterium]